MQREILSVFICLSIVFTGFGQNGHISGSVTDAVGESLIQASLRLTSDQDTLSTITDLDGQYHFEAPVGEYKLLVSYLGMESEQRSFRLNMNENKLLDFVLSSSSTMIELTVVTGTTKDEQFGEQTVSIDIMPSSLVENTIARSGEALNRIPGYQQIGNSPSIRGGSGWSGGASSRTLFLIDGIPQLSPENGAIYFETLPLENIDQVEIIKGATSSLYGSSALNGIINFRTAWPTSDKPYHRVTTSLGMYQRFDANLIRSKNDPGRRMQNMYDAWDYKEHVPIYFNQTYEHRERFKKIDFVLGAFYRHDGGFRKNNEYDRFRVNGKIRHLHTSDEGILKSVSGLAWNFAYEEGGQFFFWSGLDSMALLPSDPKSPYILDARTDYIQRRMSLAPFATFYTPNNGEHILQSKYYNNMSTNFGAEQVMTHHVFGEYQYKWSNEKTGYSFVGGLSTYYTNGRGLSYGDKTYDAFNVSGYIQADKVFWSKLTLSMGTRLEYNKIDSITPNNQLPFISRLSNATIELPVKPLFRLGLNYKVTQGSWLRASWGQGFRVPTINEYFIDLTRGLQVLPNPNIIPEDGWTSEIGFKQGFQIDRWQGFLDLAGFYTKYINVIDFNTVFDPGGAPYVRAKNLDDARIYGMEVSVMGRGSLFGVPLQLLSGYTYMQPELLNPSNLRLQTFGEDGKLLNFRNKHAFKSDMEMSFGRYSTGFTAIYNSFMIMVPEAQVLIPGVDEYRENNMNGEWVVDCRFIVQLNESARLTGVVKNLFNNEYTTRPAALEAPRNYALQFQYEC